MPEPDGDFLREVIRKVEKEQRRKVLPHYMNWYYLMSWLGTT